MKKYLTKDSIAYIGLKAGIWLSGILPVRAGLALGGFIGTLMYFIYSKRKKIAYANLKAAFSAEKSPREIKKLLRETFKNYGQTISEFVRMPSMSSAYIKDHAKIEKPEVIGEGRSSGSGTIFLTAHFGNWELSSPASAVNGNPIYVLATPQKLPRVNGLINEVREKFGCKVVNKGMASREIIRALKANEIVGILSDQDAGKRGTFVNFFNRPASCATGAFHLARRTGATIVPTFIIRKGGPFHSIKFEPPIKLSEDRNAEWEIKEKLKIFINLQEAYIRKYPEQWLWVHKRWKSTPLRRVTILSDGKPGHVNQSKAVLNIYKKCREDSGYGADQTETRYIDIKFKDAARKKLLGVLSRLASGSCQGCMRCPRFCLTDKSYSELMADYSDMVISCGSSLAAVNVFLAIENNARNIVIMKPGIAPLSRFSLAIIPKHDKPPPGRENVLQTMGSPNSAGENFSPDNARDLSGKISSGKEKKIGLLLGGENDEFRITVELAEKIVSHVESLAISLDAEILATTSRRTPKDVEEYVEKRLGNNDRCRLLVIPNKANIPDAVNSISALSSVIIVSGDSISMVSEAASSGKSVLVFDLEKKRRRASKHSRLLTELAESGYIVHAPVDRIKENALRILRRNDPVKALGDSKKIYKAVHKII